MEGAEFTTMVVPREDGSVELRLHGGRFVLQADEARMVGRALLGLRGVPRGCRPEGTLALVELVGSEELQIDDVFFADGAWCVVGEEQRDDGTFEAAEVIDDAGGIDLPEEFFEGTYLRVVSP